MTYLSLKIGHMTNHIKEGGEDGTNCIVGNTDKQQEYDEYAYREAGERQNV